MALVATFSRLVGAPHPPAQGCARLTRALATADVRSQVFLEVRSSILAALGSANHGAGHTWSALVSAGRHRQADDRCRSGHCTCRKHRWSGGPFLLARIHPERSLARAPE